MFFKTSVLSLLLAVGSSIQVLGQSFVQKTGDRLTLNGKPFVIAGANVYWLGLDENVVPNPSYPSKQRINEILQIAKNLGVNVIRAHTLGVSTGTHLSLLRGKNDWNEAAFEPIDYAVHAAGRYGIRLIVPSTDNYRYYHGGKFDFLKFNGIGTSDWNAGQFYTNENVVRDFEEVIFVGSAVWFLMGRDDTCSKWVPHEDGTGTTLHFPGSTAEMQRRALLIRHHHFRYRGEPVPADTGAPSCPVLLPSA